MSVTDPSEGKVIGSMAGWEGDQVVNTLNTLNTQSKHHTFNSYQFTMVKTSFSTSDPIPKYMK